MARDPNRPLRVAVTGGGALLGQGILRALKHSALNIWTIVVDVSPHSAGLYWGNESYLVPPASSPEYGEAIRSLFQRTSPDVLLVGTDVELAPLAAARAAIEAEFGAKVLVSSPEVVAIADDKLLTAGFFRGIGAAAPASADGSDRAAIDALIASQGFPLIVKPRIGARSYGVSQVRNREELDRALAAITGGLVQECVGDERQEYTASGLYFDGRCDALIVMRRDLRDGNTYRAYSVHDAGLDDHVRRWTEALQPHGPANFQFRIDRNGAPKVFEINARFSGTTPLRAHAGFNEVDMCLRRLLLDEPIVQPSIRTVAILRHWSETVISPDRADTVERL